MYCVRCGVCLQEEMKNCPLCGTPVWNPDEPQKDGMHKETKSSTGRYSNRMPYQYRNSLIPQAIILTVLTVIAGVIVGMLCLQLYGALRWGGYVLFGLLQFYVTVVLPLWFRKPNPVIFLPIIHVCAALFLLYICIKTGGHWYMSFAFPIVLASCILTTGFTVLLKYVRGGRYYIFGAFFLVLAGFILLIELFEHVSFGIPLFRWSQYPAITLGGIGIFLILAGIISPLREYLNRNFYI